LGLGAWHLGILGQQSVLGKGVGPSNFVSYLSKSCAHMGLWNVVLQSLMWNCPCWPLFFSVVCAPAIIVSFWWLRTYQPLSLCRAFPPALPVPPLRWRSLSPVFPGWFLIL
jgi:hypothetical protein